jgi:hypothetical protein
LPYGAGRVFRADHVVAIAITLVNRAGLGVALVKRAQASYGTAAFIPVCKHGMGRNRAGRDYGDNKKDCSPVSLAAGRTRNVIAGRGIAAASGLFYLRFVSVHIVFSRIQD